MVRWGIAGFGLHGVKRLLPAFAHTEHSRLQAISRSTAERARGSAKQHRIPLAFGSTEELCASPEVDAILIASPDGLHLRDVLAAVAARKAVLCEKPMAMNSVEAEQMVAAARAAGVPLGVAQIFRFHDTVRRIRELVAGGVIGKPVLARCDFSFWGVGHARSWMHDASLACGGPTADVGVHCIDTLRFILQDEVRFISAFAQKDSPADPFEHTAALSLEFSRGTLASVAVSIHAQYRTPIEIIGERGTISAHDGLVVEQPTRIVIIANGETRTEELSNHLAFARQFDAFSLAIEGRHTFECPGKEGLINQRILDAAFHSMRSGHSVRL